MKNPTTRQKAEAIVAMVRAEYPNPRENSSAGYYDAYMKGEMWYCVGAAYAMFSEKHPRLVPYMGWPVKYTRNKIIKLNNSGDMPAAWSALTDEVEKALEA